MPACNARAYVTSVMKAMDQLLQSMRDIRTPTAQITQLIAERHYETNRNDETKLLTEAEKEAGTAARTASKASTTGYRCFDKCVKHAY